jgi:hypothetical protein
MKDFYNGAQRRLSFRVVVTGAKNEVWDSSIGKRGISYLAPIKVILFRDHRKHDLWPSLCANFKAITIRIGPPHDLLA